ncbi:MAG: IS66 family insertion sequence element accessory protein TnpB [Verrucomicrobiaceae bacterium]|nr:IS66 family insertion sequence element accessory protein TnpB [Verrucomicrobiaceae bacterium]
MLNFTGSLKVFVALDPIDMRKGFEGLHTAVGEKLKADVRSGALFAFTNKKRTRLKIIYWDKTGLWLLTKRLEKGTFSWPRSVEPGAARLSLAPEAFALLTDGIDMHAATLRPWYQRDRKPNAGVREENAKLVHLLLFIPASMMTPLEAQLTEQNKALRVEIKLLREKVDLLVRRIFGAKSEQLDEAQLMLLLQGEDEAAKKAAAASAADACGLEAEIDRRAKENKPRKERKKRVPEHLPAVDEVIEPQEVQAAPEAWRHIGSEIAEQLDYEPARFLRRRIIRQKYVKRDEPHKAPVIAPLNTLQERSIAAPGLLAQIIVAKYCDHLPLYRQEQIYLTRHALSIPRQSMARWLGLAADWLRPICELIHTGVMAGGYVQIDETPIEHLLRLV